ncbi:hypothetical protein NCS52_00323000 [Fusarium sp. LHS14.1]|nr:hypothetical protein NCS52_00323000 [Fusarium sp. LHS14.1]
MERAANWLRQLKAVYDTDPATFYLHIDTWQEEKVTRVRVFRMDDYADWIALNYGQFRCFTGIFQAFPRATLTACLQAVDVVNGHHGTYAKFMKWVVNMPEFPASDTRIPKKTMHATQMYDLTDFQHTLTCTRKTSHRKMLRPSKNGCREGKEGSPVLRKALATMSTATRLRARTGKIIIEYESLGNPTVISLPPQIKSTKGPPLLTIDSQIFRWQDEVCVLDREIPCPPTQQGLVDGKPDSLK